MDISELKQIADAAFDHIVFRKQLRERVQAELVFAYNGGLFKAAPELITFVSAWPKIRPLFLEDVHGNPIAVTDQELFLSQCMERYQTQMNAWHTEFEQARKIRKGRDLV